MTSETKFDYVWKNCNCSNCKEKVKVITEMMHSSSGKIESTEETNSSSCTDVWTCPHCHAKNIYNPYKNDYKHAEPIGAAKRKELLEDGAVFTKPKNS